MKLTTSQKQAIEKIEFFIKSNERFFTLMGRGGTGKTTIIGEVLKERYRNTYTVCSVSHVATKILSNSVKNKTGLTPIYSTVASIFGLRPQGEKGFQLTDVKTLLKYSKQDIHKSYDCDLLILDECSMISQKVFERIEEIAELCGFKVIFMGDPAQLPPVGEIKDSPTFDVENKFALTEIMRQGVDSPIIDLSMMYANNVVGGGNSQLRITDRVNKITDSGSVEFMNPQEAKEEMFRVFSENPKENRVVAFTNDTVGKINKMIRNELFGKDSEQIMVGDLLFCGNTAENSFLGNGSVYNGEVYEVLEIHSKDVRYVHKVQLKDTDDVSEILKSLKLEFYQVTASPLSSDGNETLVISVPTKKAQKNWSDFLYEYSLLLKGKLPHTTLFVENESLDKMKGLVEDFLKTNGKIKDLVHFIYPKLHGTSIRRSTWDSFWQLKSEFPTFEYAFAITAHKAQGSTYNTVFAIEDDLRSIEKYSGSKVFNQISYVATSRAAKRLIMVSKNNMNEF